MEEKKNWNAALNLARLGAFTYVSSIGMSNSFWAYAINLFKSVLLIAPIGLMSALEQSYFVK